MVVVSVCVYFRTPVSFGSDARTTPPAPRMGLEILVAACRLDIPSALDPGRVRSKPLVAIPPLANSYAERRGGGRLKNKVIAIVSSRITRKPLVFRAANPVRKVSSVAAEKAWLSGEP